MPDLRHITATQLHALAVPISSLVLDPDNENQHPAENLADIRHGLLYYGVRLPLTIRADGRTVSTGNGTLTVLRELAEERAVGLWPGAPSEPLDWAHVPAVEMDDDARTAAGWRLAHNNSSARSFLDPDAVAATLEAFPDFALDELCFVAEDLTELGIDWTAEDEPEDPRPPAGRTRDPAPPGEPITRSGDVWMLGDHRLACGDQDPRWCDNTARRWEVESGEAAQLVRNGEVVGHEFEHVARRTPARDGDKRQARRRVQTLIENGTLPRPDEVSCVDCNAKPGREYDHHLGYDAAHHEHVEALCASCHHSREIARGVR